MSATSPVSATSPTAIAAVAAPDRADLQREILAAFDGNIQPVKTSLAYRFGKGRISIAEYLFDKMPHPESPGELYDGAESLLNMLINLNARMLGRLCMFAEAVESQFGLPPLPAPVESAD